MPVKKICRCGKLIDESQIKCNKCDSRKSETEKKYDQRRGTSSERGYDSRWRKYRIGFLRKNPLCIECMKEGRLTPATVLDHIEPHKGNKELFWDPKNHQGLCKHHHDVKTAKEDGGFGNRQAVSK